MYALNSSARWPNNGPKSALAAIFVLGIAMLIAAPRAIAQDAKAANSPAAKKAAHGNKSVEIIKDFLQNTAPDKVDAAARRLVADDATYISLNFDNPELKKIEPWAGTGTGPQAFSSTFARVAKYWTIEEFTVTSIFGSGEDVAVFGSFQYRSVAVGTSFRSPFSIHAKVKNGKIVYFQFMEDTYASASSFRQSGSWTVKTDPNGPAYEVGGNK